MCSDQLISFSLSGIPIKFRLEAAPQSMLTASVCGPSESSGPDNASLIRKETLQSNFKALMPKNDSSA